MEKQDKGAYENNEGSGRIRDILSWIPLLILMVFYAGTWSFPYFYHITERYNSLIIFIALALLFFIRVDVIKALKNKDIYLILTAVSLLTATVNLFIIDSNKGCILILADFLLILYMGKEVSLSRVQTGVLSVFFLLMYASWFFYDRAFSYNSNTGATYTVFTLFAALILLKRFYEKYELCGLFIVMAFLRTVTLVFWHLARGAFLALFFFAVFYCLFLLFDPSRYKKLYKFICVFAVFGSLLFVYLYVQLSKTGFNAEMPFFYKNIFSGREQIWSEIWDMLKPRLLTGIGSGYELKSFFEYNIHNAMYDILAVHGILVFAVTAVIMIGRLYQMRDNIRKSPTTLIASSAVFAIFFESFIDMDLMWADYSPVLLFLLLQCFNVRQEQIKPEVFDGKKAGK
ncbi:MAG: O-antigen ligase family protein [Lachnospiraceae bacterium]|nr:O-antigen ligase family protein [Lachnospiraceae bacterium]